MSVSYWDQRLYPDMTKWEATPQFIELISERITESSTVLDIGAGAGERSIYQFKGKCQEMIGVDMDPQVVNNPLLDKGILIDGKTLPFQNNTFDLAFSIYVLEHVGDPKTFCREVSRVLKPGGEYWALTPNRFHYVPIIASLTPTKFHKWINKKRGRDEADTFPTFYRLNTAGALKKHFERAGLELLEMQAIEVRPNYLQFSLPLYLLGAAYERIVNSSKLFSSLRVNYIVGFRKTKP
jgi:SAM-dependent methyltransferase